MTLLINELIKHNPVTEYIYNKYLDYKIRNVESFIFVACTGRSGSLSLTEIFSAVDNCACYHEPHPNMISEYSPGDDKKKYFDRMFTKLKRVYIKRGAIGYKYYVETNHMFIKNFSRQVIRYFEDRLSIIHLVRNPVGVASSLYKLNDIPGGNQRALYYYLNPRDADNRINIQDLLYENPDFQHDYYKCLWYFYEIEARISELKSEYPSLFRFKISTNELNNISVLHEMFTSLNLPVNEEKLNKLVGTSINQRPGEKINLIEREDEISMNKKLIFELKKRYGELVSEWNI